jgi:twitching motility protein PilT
MTLETHEVFDIDKILFYGIRVNASDINITSDMDIYVRVNGDIEKIEIKPTQTLMNNYVDKLTSSSGKKVDIYRNESVDGSYTLKFNNEEYFFRYNIVLSNNRIHITIRKLIHKIPKFEDIQITTEKELEFIERINKNINGLYLLVGATGSGKTTTIVTILDYVLKQNKIKAISLEEPIEFYFDNKYYEHSFIIQREIGKDTKSFYSGLVEAMRQNPDIIFVGEIRDQQTASAALNASLTGHVVIATLHAKSIEKTKDRFKYLLEGITNDFDFIQGIIYQQLNKDSSGTIKAERDVYINHD